MLVKSNKRDTKNLVKAISGIFSLTKTKAYHREVPRLGYPMVTLLIKRLCIHISIMLTSPFASFANLAGPGTGLNVSAIASEVETNINVSYLQVV
jgi:hypothetical protein